jgi:hypothetical protein
MRASILIQFLAEAFALVCLPIADAATAKAFNTSLTGQTLRQTAEQAKDDVVVRRGVGVEDPAGEAAYSLGGATPEASELREKTCAADLVVVARQRSEQEVNAPFPTWFLPRSSLAHPAAQSPLLLFLRAIPGSSTFDSFAHSAYDINREPAVSILNAKPLGLPVEDALGEIGSAATLCRYGPGSGALEH